MHTGPEISWDRLAELRSEIGEDDFAEVMDLFLTEVEETLGRLSPMIPPSELANELHGLRGSAANLGMSALATLCSAAEAAVQDGAGPPDIEELADVFARSRASLAARGV